MGRMQTLSESSTLHWYPQTAAAGNPPPASIGVNGDTLITYYASSGYQINPLTMYRKVAGVWKLMTVLAAPPTTMNYRKVYSSDGIGPASPPSFNAQFVGNVGNVPTAGSIFTHVSGTWSQGSSRFYPSSTGPKCAIICTTNGTGGDYSIAWPAIQVATVRVNTLPTETDAQAGVCIADPSCGSGIWAGADSTGRIYMGLGLLTNNIASNAYTQTATSVFAAGNRLVMIRNGPIVSVSAFDTTTQLKKSGSDLQMYLDPDGVDGSWANGPGVQCCNTTVARFSSFSAVG